MRSIAALIVVLLAAVITGPAQATVRITDDMGGLMTEYASRFASLRASGEKVVIDGPCFSACTMLLGMLSRNQVCVTPNAVLGFHAAWNFDDSGRRVTSVSATQELIDIYPQPIRSWIARRGGLSPHMKFLRGRDLAALYPMCGSESQRTETTRATHNRTGRTWRRIAISASARSASER
jgi:hypothetical protein